MHEGTHDFQTNYKNNLDDSVKAKWRVKLSPTQTLHHHNASAASLLGKAFHCTDTTHALFRWNADEKKNEMF
jgi:hypothetical protein